MVTYIVTAVVSTVIGAILAFFIKSIHDARRLKDVRSESERIIEEAKGKAKDIIHESRIKAKDEEKVALEKIKDEERKIRVKEAEINASKRELDDKFTRLKEFERELKDRERRMGKRETEIAESRAKVSELLQKIAGMSKEEAMEHLLNEVRDDAEREAARIFKEAEQKAHERSDEIAHKIIASAIQRCAYSYNYDKSTSYVNIQDDSIKGRIIGRDGRNIRAFEQITGVDVIIDDTPNIVVLSCFDPVKREIAKIAMQRLVDDGRIHPARIEEVVEWASKEIEKDIQKVGRDTVYELGLKNMHPELVKLVGRLKYRTSYTQNVLDHSKEVAYISGHIAWELGLDGYIARRAGLFHDLGKALDQTVEGSHVDAGVEALKRYGEPKEVIEAIEQHHLENPDNLYGLIVQVSDALSASRPGARLDTYELYIKRMEDLENLANSFDGVEKAWALQAGREIRIIVKPSEIDDEMVYLLARDVVQKIEKEIKYPGEIKVTVVREVKAQELAK